MGAIFRRFEKYTDVLTQASLVLEIGTARQGDDNSTVYLEELAKSHLCKFVTVDVDTDNLENARRLDINVYHGKGEDFCRQELPYYNKIAMAYLDNFDWDWNPPKEEPFIKEQQALYRSKYDMDMNNVASQSAHVMQTMMMIPHLAEHCVIGFDDTFYMPHLGHYTGKGAAAVPLLLGLGFKIVEEEENPVYGLILKR